MPAHFCILGGLVYSQFSWDGLLAPVASYASWVAPDGASALIALTATLVTLGAELDELLDRGAPREES